MSDHVRNTGPMLASPRCGAKTRCDGRAKFRMVRQGQLNPLLSHNVDPLLWKRGVRIRRNGHDFWRNLRSGLSKKQTEIEGHLCNQGAGRDDVNDRKRLVLGEYRDEVILQDKGFASRRWCRQRDPFRGRELAPEVVLEICENQLLFVDHDGA
jgi:hypothetical protein